MCSEEKLRNCPMEVAFSLSSHHLGGQAYDFWGGIHSQAHAHFCFAQLQPVQAQYRHSSIRRRYIHMHEVKKIKDLNIPTVLKCLQVIKTKRNLYLVYEHFPQCNLSQYIEKYNSPLYKSDLLAYLRAPFRQEDLWNSPRNSSKRLYLCQPVPSINPCRWDYSWTEVHWLLVSCQCQKTLNRTKSFSQHLVRPRYWILCPRSHQRKYSHFCIRHL